MAPFQRLLGDYPGVCPPRRHSLDGKAGQRTVGESREAKVRSEGAKDRVVLSVLSFSYGCTKDRGNKSDREPCAKQGFRSSCLFNKKAKKRESKIEINGAPIWLSPWSMRLLILGLWFEPHIGCRDCLNKEIKLKKKKRKKEKKKKKRVELNDRKWM